jgi:DNA-binding response OmpR family regulator
LVQERPRRAAARPELLPSRVEEGEACEPDQKARFLHRPGANPGFPVRILKYVVDAPPRPRTIAVIEDEVSIASAVAARLRSEGYQVEVAADGVSGVDLCERTRPDLVVLDLMLPGLDGLEVCRRIQRDRATPVLMLTARDSETDLVIGLGVGADDYMTKPFSARELVARVSAILRRADRNEVSDGADGDGAVMRVGDVEIETASRRVRLDGELVHLTPTEFDLLVYLAARPSRVATREELLEQVWGYDVPSGARTVDSHVRSLRRKLGSPVVRTVHGVGYAAQDRV